MPFAPFLLAALTALPATTQAPARKPVVALLPIQASSPDLENLGLLIEARASELLEAAGKTQELHLREVLAMLDDEKLDLARERGAAQLARVALGADRVVRASLRQVGEHLVLEGAVVDPTRETVFTSARTVGWPDTLQAASQAIAQALVGAAVPSGATQPQSASSAALMALAQCWAVALRQPLGIEAPVVLDDAQLNAAIAECRSALALDPSLQFAQSTLALLQAIVGDDRGAVKSLEGLAQVAEHVESYTLARFWLLTRYQSNRSGLEFLRRAVEQHPAELTLRLRLAETLTALNDQRLALAQWQQLLALVPNSPMVLGQLSRVQAKAGHLELALSTAQRGLALAPRSRQAALQLASRWLDLGKPSEAIALLAPVAAAPDASGELLLRLGWAHWLKGELDRAASLFEAAHDRARGPASWQTRGHALADLALVEARRGRPDAARAAIRRAVLTGFRTKTVDPSLAAYWAEALNGPLDADDAGAPLRLVPHQSSLFPLNAFGDVEPERPKPQPPEGLILFRF